MSNLKNLFYASVGLILKSKDKVEAAARKFVKENKIEAEEGKKFIDTAVKRVEAAKKDLSKKLDTVVKTAVDKVNSATSKEINALKNEVLRLKKKLGDSGKDDVKKTSDKHGKK
ncbi:MAG: hypothetical protein LBL71_01205 [Endomicrobium sp.]|jgi:polyhydroxyalkanoate synthesis regulator phasin|nr:hypothetical protein [Endomicrobium sp.]